jgi:hypothetical protein
MIVKAVKLAPRLVTSLIFAVTLWLAVLLVAAVSVLGLTLALQGWASNPASTTIQVPAQR